MSNTGILIDWNEALNQIANDGINIGLFIWFIFVLFLVWIFVYIKFIKTSDWNTVWDIRDNTWPVLVWNDSEIKD